MNTLIRRIIHPEIKVLDAKTGTVEYVASDETVDSYKEVIRADGWRFNHFAKNPVFVNSHDYNSIDHILGKVVDYRVVGRRLINTVQWARGIGNKLADIGWKLTEGGFLKAVSVGFWPIRMLTKADKDYSTQLKELDLTPDHEVRAIYVQQEQIELSAVILGANPNALIAKSYKAGILTDEDLESFSTETTERTTAAATPSPAEVAAALRQAQATAFYDRISRALNQQ